MNELSGAEALVRMLEAHGVRHVFGLCADTSLPFYDALYRLDHGIRHVLCRDERSAAYMADAYARVSGLVGVCEGPSGGGATYILPGVVEANESSVPLLCLTTDVAVSSRGRFALTELDQEALFRPLTKWNVVVERADAIPRAVRRAFAEITAGRPGAAHIGLPYDVQTGPVDEAEIWAEAGHGRVPSARLGPEPAAVAAAAEAILSAQDPVFVCGGGVVISGAEGELVALAETLGAAVATSVSGQGSIPDDHPLAVGVVGSNGGTPETRGLVDAADLVIFVGCRAGSVTTERWRHPDPARARVVHVDADPGVVGVNYRTEAALVGDARLALAALLAEVRGRGGDLGPRASAAPRVARAKARKFDRFRALAARDDRPILPERVIAELQAALPDDAVVIADPGTPCPYASAYLEFFRSGRRLISNRAHGALGYALPAALGAHLGRPGATCVALMGDGSFAMAAGELETIVRLGAPLTMVVLSNASFGWIKAGQRHGFGQRFFSVDFQPTDHARVAEAFGVKAWRVEDPGALGAELAAALEHDGPALVDVVVQPLDEAAAPVSEWVA